MFNLDNFTPWQRRKLQSSGLARSVSVWISNGGPPSVLSAAPACHHLLSPGGSSCRLGSSDSLRC